jgi:hypothetical protein
MKRDRAQLLNDFTGAIIEQNACIMDGNPKTGNRAAKRYITAARQLLSGGEESIDAFAGLLKHGNPSVRCMAAAFLLKDRTRLSVMALKPIAKGDGLAALGAQMTLKRFKDGNLDIT